MAPWNGSAPLRGGGALPEPLLDTSIFIDLFRGGEAARDYIGTRLRTRRLPLHAAVAAELLAGVRGKSEIRQFDALCAATRPVHPTKSDWTLALRLGRMHTHASGTDWVDCLLAAPACACPCPWQP